MGLFSIFSKKNNEIKKEITEDKNVVLSNESVNEADNKADKENDNKSALENSVEPEQKSDEVKVDISEDKNNSSEEKKKNKISFFEKLRKTRENLSYGLSALVKGRKIDDDLYDDLETSLLTADLGVETTQKVIEKLKKESKLRELHDASALKENLKIILNEILRDCAEPLKIEKNTQMPYVILMVGVNGAGKTTTIGKLASKFKAQGLKVMLAAGDTFRAAAVEQLKTWGDRCDIPVVSQPTGSDSASVIYDALSSAIAHKTDVLICDTAGRLQNKDNLMEELKKITRVMKKHSESVPNEVMLVLDSTTGQNAISQMKIFSQAVNVTGITLTKLDGTAKGGIIFALSDQFKVPVRYIGIGEKVEDLREFDSESFVDALVD
ncbi:signal recognition particle-docking protein FtsY [Succinivibrio sp.]|uniref:signal recognition particle-docking protein FtsY n=1 Tax=Succinivibrio sp. TaxID=2053619 RepID=UPI00386DF1CD